MTIPLIKVRPDLSNSFVITTPSPKKEAAKTEFTIIQDLSKHEIEFDARLSNPKAWYDHLFKKNDQMAFYI
jgi:hypothetical protein